ncbi:Transformation/transcription domain-associated protein [Aphelenchoides bicaudatus]|nr:Transformation/transcription domain-associated protein [Aphelenchoides bicaudatus]
MIKYIFLPVQEITSKLAKCHVTEETSMYSERQLFEQFFVQSIRCLEIFKIVLAAASSQPSQVSAQLKSSLAKDEKETVETFALVFYDADPKLFRYIFGRQINFFIDAFIANTSVQLVCKLFLLSDKTFTSTGSILMKHMLKHMSELGVSGQISSSSSTSDKTNVYLRLFREIFHIVSGLNNDQQPQRVSVTATERQARSKEHEAMLIVSFRQLDSPYLHQIVSDSIQLALRSRDPNHYFALLHALFRSIGTGSHDQLYQQFLPLLPSILQQLNRFQNGSYRQPIHDLYVELCLTVPVRLSSLLPYLPKLMDPLVCALNGTSKLVMQGLRTLELFVNNLQLDYIYDQMLPVRAALMQGIWRALYTQELHYAMLALKILGKLGGSSRRAFMDPQNFTYVDLEDIGRSIGPRALYAAGHASYNCEPPKLCVQTELTITQKPDTTTKSADTGPQKRKLDNGTESEETVSKKQQLDEEKTEPIAAESDTKEATEQSEQVTEEPKLQVTAQLPMAQLVDSALTMIRSSMVNEPTPALNLNWAHWIAAASQFVTNTQTTPGKVPKQQAVELCKSIVLQSIKESPLLKLHSEEKLKPLFQKTMQAYNEQKNQQKQSYQCENSKSRAVIGSALTGLFYAAVSSELRPQSLSVYRAIISHLTLQALLESMAVDLSELEEQMEVDGQAPLQQPRDLLDASILIDVICQTLSDSCKHFAQAGIVALRFINIILKSLFDTPEELNQAYELPFFDVLLKRIHQLSCRRDWFCKLGGCTALRFFVDNFTREFVLRNVELFMQSFFTTISGLADEVSYGAVDVACKAMDQLIDVCAGVNEDEKRDFDAHSLHEFVQLVSSNLTNAEQQIRAEVNRLLVRLLELTGKTKLELLCGNVEHLKQVLLSGFVQFSSMSIGSQLGLLDFMHQHLIDLQLVTDPSYVDQSLAFVSNLMTIIENTDIALHSMPSSRYSITNLPGGSHSLEDQMRFLRVASLQALGQHSLALLSLKQKLEQSISSDELEMERLNLALSAIDLNQIQIDANGSNPDNEKQLERMRWTLRYASPVSKCSI